MLKSTEIDPLFDRVLVRQESQRQSAGGIFVPREQGDRSQIMSVIKAGNGLCDDGSQIKMLVKEGDRIIAAKYSGTEVNTDSEKLLIIKHCDILAKITDEVR
jgi:chaperonin GroES